MEVPIEIPGYEILQEVLRKGRHVVCRGRRRSDRSAVLLKTSIRPSAREAQALRREFDLLRTLSTAGVPRVGDFVETAGAPCLVLEDCGFQPLADLLRDGPLGRAFFFPIASSLCDVLAELHHRDVIPGSISPTSVWVDPTLGGVELLDFGTAASVAGEMRASSLTDATAYMSPEQTGRINRAIDHRTDFYSLGATLYEMLCGTPPFQFEDSSELIHSHIAKTPTAPAALRADLPQQLSRIVMKLLAKEAGDRYQSASGVKHDLERCAREWAIHGTIEPFDLGQQDVSERFLIPQRLYGRDREVANLLKAFEETCDGGNQLLLVSGYSGIGKTSLIQELYKPIIRERGYFISGKFDQVVRNIPYGALIQAFRGLVWQLLTESEERLEVWRERLSKALGANGGVLAEVIPEIELILGQQASPAPLDPAESQNRFQYVFQNFVGTLAQKEHPLVVFLDDLQWVDAATLDLLHALLTGSDIRHLLLVCAYRDNEVGADHLLTWAVGRLVTSGATLRRMPLAPLALADLVPFLCDTLHVESSEVDPLAKLIQQKTDGNPFFVIQFLKTLEQEKFLTFNRENARWTFRTDVIAQAGMTDNVIDLMTHRIRRLSPGAQAMVTLAACIGNPFEWNTYLTVSRQPPGEAAAGLAEALEAGLIQPAGDSYNAPESDTHARVSYSFLHDRVQQAAYALIPEGRKKPLHLDVGRLLLGGQGEAPDERIFEIVNHLNIGSDLIETEAERMSVARLNLAAGRKAKTSAAYVAATEYLDAGIALLAEEHWQRAYELMFALHLEAAECRYLSRAFEKAEEDFKRLLERAVTPLDRAQVHTLRITLYENQSRWTDAMGSGQDGLALFGIAFPERAEDKQVALDREVELTQHALGERTIGSLVDLPEMTDPTMRMVMRILTILWAPAYISGDQLIARLISATMVRLSLAHGNTEDSAYGYVTHAITIGPIRKDYRSAYEWGELALKVNERFHDAKRRAKIHQQFQAHVNLWCRPFETCLPHAQEACRSGLETGDFTYAGYGAATEGWSAFFTSRSLERFVQVYSPHLALLAKIKMTDFLAAHQVMLNWALALQGRTSGRLSLSDATFDEQAYIATYQASASFFLTFVYTARLHLAVMFEDFAAARHAARCAREVALAGTIWPVLIDFWGALASASTYASMGVGEQRSCWQEFLGVQASLAQLAEICPENFRCFSLLLSAEMLRIRSRSADATQLCEDAVAYARETGNVQHEAVACEFAARNWVARGHETIAAAFMEEARRCYAEWGAVAKVSHLEQNYGHLLVPKASVLPMATRPAVALTTVSEPPSLDIATVLKVAQAITIEIELDSLLRRLIKLAVENAGAQRGVFLQQHDGTLVVEVEADADPEQVTVRQAIPLEQADGLSHSVVRYVQRTGHDVVIGNATADERFAGDPYINRVRSKSILCVPVGHQGRLGGILYLENNLTTEAFTPARLEMMRTLAAQAAISLENARLYEAMKTEVTRRTSAEQALRIAMSELEGLKNRLEVENVYLQEEIRTQHNFNEIVGNSPALLEALRKVERVASTESTVLIVGETGSGKELFARAVHSRSRRNDRPLVKVNCGAIAPGLVESELFGHVKGAFTGAIEKRIGRFEVANGGTIFLDEVGELPLEAQVKLLRVLQEQEFEPVGSSRTVRVNIRVIAATNRNLEQAVQEGKFRADLLYRLNVFPIDVPPLRARPSDIRLLVGFFVAGLARKLGKPVQGFNARSMERILSYSWPGNVRELQNVVERAAILAQGPVLDVEGTFLGTSSSTTSERPPASPGETLDDVQRLHILTVLKTTGGVVEGARGAAMVLGVHPNTLRSRMKKLGISATPVNQS